MNLAMHYNWKSSSRAAQADWRVCRISIIAAMLPPHLPSLMSLENILCRWVYTNMILSRYKQNYTTVLSNFIQTLHFSCQLLYNCIVLVHLYVNAQFPVLISFSQNTQRLLIIKGVVNDSGQATSFAYIMFCEAENVECICRNFLELSQQRISSRL